MKIGDKNDIEGLSMKEEMSPRFLYQCIDLSRRLHSLVTKLEAKGQGFHHLLRKRFVMSDVK